MRLFKVLFFVLVLSISSYSQSSSSAARRIISGTADPSTCQPTGSNIFYRSDLGILKVCTATNTFTALTSSASTSLQTITINGITAGPTDGLILQNTTPAINGTQQVSPALSFIGQGFQTGTSTSQQVKWAIDNVPLQSAGANPTDYLRFSENVNGGGLVEAFTVTRLSAGQYSFGFLGHNNASNPNFYTNGTFLVVNANAVGNGQLYLNFDNVSGIVDVRSPIAFQKTITTAGTTGAQTISKTTGSVNFAAAATSLVVTNTLVSTTSIILCTVGTNDSTMKSVQCVAAAGSFTIFANAAATAETRVNFLVSN